MKQRDGIVNLMEEINNQLKIYSFGREKQACLRFALLIWVGAIFVYGFFWLGLSLDILESPWPEPMTGVDRRGRIGFFASLPIISLTGFFCRAALSEKGIMIAKGKVISWESITDAVVQDRSFGLGLLYLTISYLDSGSNQYLYLPWPVDKPNEFKEVILANTDSSNTLHKFLIQHAELNR